MGRSREESRKKENEGKKREAWNPRNSKSRRYGSGQAFHAPKRQGRAAGTRARTLPCTGGQLSPLLLIIGAAATCVAAGVLAWAARWRAHAVPARLHADNTPARSRRWSSRSRIARHSASGRKDRVGLGGRRVGGEERPRERWPCGEMLGEQAVERALGTRPAGRRRSGIRTPARCSLVVGPGRMRLRTKRAPRSGDGLPNLTSSSSFSNVCVRDVFFVECWCARCVRLHGWFVWSCTVLDGVRACSCACLVCGCLGRERGTMSFTSLHHTNAVVPSGDICNYTDMSAATRARL